MKVKRLQKMQLKKVRISRINEEAVNQVKGGTRQGSVDDSALISHCAAIQCY